MLLNLFRLASVEDKNPVGNIILNELQNPFVKAYLMFFKFVLPVFNRFNAMLQCCRQLCSNFLGPECFKNEAIYELDPYNPRSLLPIEQISVGPHAMDCIKSCDKLSQDQFKLKCLSFYQKAVLESSKKFLF